MALTPVQQVNLLIGNIPSNPFYPIYSDEEIQQFLDLAGQNVYKAARLAAISAAFVISSFSTREVTGDIEVWSEYGKNYLAALNNFIRDPTLLIPEGLFPWSASTNCKSKLLSIQLCDGDECRDGCGSGCGCEECHKHGDIFEYPIV